MPENVWLILRRWFLERKRDLPWRLSSNPYSVWISEVMLQQTQVAAVIPYFERWMEKFPSLSSLAEAGEEEVMKAWEGLGYYRRVRHLHKAAQLIIAKGGIFPKEEAAIRQLPGMGPYTTGAVLAFAFKQKKAAVDGNVMRVLARFLGIEDDISSSKTENNIRELADRLLPEEEPWVIAEAWIELGALICRKKPLCHECPLQKGCQAYKQGLTEKIPVKSKKIAVTHLEREVALILSGHQILIRKVPSGEVMEGLHEFPYFEKGGDSLESKIECQWSCKLDFLGHLKEVKHTFTRYQVKLYPFIYESTGFEAKHPFFWVPLAETGQLPFSSGHRRVLESLRRKFAS
jgi:A/G-specific adenine glycosylase